MGFLDKLRASMARWMSGRYGADQLSMAMVIAALVVSILGTFTGARAVAMVLSDALLIVAFFRMLSKDRYRRAHENEVYLSKIEGARRGFTEWLNRVKNGKKYRYPESFSHKKFHSVRIAILNIHSSHLRVM